MGSSGAKGGRDEPAPSGNGRARASSGRMLGMMLALEPVTGDALPTDDPHSPEPLPPTPLPPTPQNPQGVPPPIDDPRGPADPAPVREPPTTQPPAIARR